MKTFKLLNCHPKKTRKNNTCYDDKVLLELKRIWNKNNKEKINSRAPSDIWKEFKMKMKECNNEICWLDKIIKDKPSIKKIKKENFVPDAPVEEWKKYNNWLSSTEFNDIMEQYSEIYPNFLYMANEIKRGKDKFGIVLNLDVHTGKGNHWVAIFIDIKKKFIFYFESTGKEIPSEVTAFNKRIVEQCAKLNIELTEMNNLSIKHQYGSSECGMYALYFIISLLLETRTTDHFLGERITDSEVEKLRDVYFNKL